MDHRFPKQLRVIRSQDFSRIMRRGLCTADGTLVLHALPAADSTAGSSRLGVTIPKKTGNAVVRNRWKRLIREAFRLQRDQMPSGYDWVVRPKKGAEPDSQAIRRSLVRLANRAAK